jgi:hypothetical protein
MPNAKIEREEERDVVALLMSRAVKDKPSVEGKMDVLEMCTLLCSVVLNRNSITPDSLSKQAKQSKGPGW